MRENDERMATGDRGRDDKTGIGTRVEREDHAIWCGGICLRDELTRDAGVGHQLCCFNQMCHIDLPRYAIAWTHLRHRCWNLISRMH